MEITPLSVGPDCVGDITLSAGVLNLALTDKTPGLNGTLNLQLPIDYFIDALVAKLGSSPTELAIATILKSAIASVG